jgi:hypothetical protein
MASNQNHTTEISSGSAKIALYGTFTFLALLVLLHFLKPEFQPSWRFISEYSIGKNGWIMQLAFIILGISCISLILSIKAHVKTVGGKIGMIVMFIVGLSLIMAGIFIMDAVTTPKNELTTHGNLHGIAAMIGVPGFPIAAILISLGLAKNTNWVFYKRILITLAIAIWICLIIMFATMFITLAKTQGVFNGNVLIGWPNRILVLSYCIWLYVVTKAAINLRSENN